jgi:hypothetical protein
VNILVENCEFEMKVRDPLPDVEFVKRQLRYAASEEKANEMAHLINNPLQRLTNTIYLAQQGGADTEMYLREASAELSQLSAIVKKLLA